MIRNKYRIVGLLALLFVAFLAWESLPLNRTK